MCTLTWRITPGGYQVLFNRDELKTRSLALNPDSFDRQKNGQRVTAFMPIDPDGNGTWICCNNYGLSLCLLNNYQGITPKTAIRSRGLLVKELAFCQSYIQVLSQIQNINLSTFAPFTLVIFAQENIAQDQAVPAIRWDGIKLHHIKKIGPVTSSSFEFKTVQANRLAQYHYNYSQYQYNRTQDSLHKQPSFCQLMSYHMSHQPTSSAYSVCMHRNDAQTVSLTIINVEPNTVSMDYHAGSPCQSNPLHALTQPRVINTEMEIEI
ncbi:MAG: NRDE family protein [Vibrio sp.]